MLDRFPYYYTVTRVRSGGRDHNGDPLPEAEEDSDDWAIAPRTTGEEDNFRQAVITGLAMYHKGPVDVVSTDRFKLPAPWDIGQWMVEGDVAYWGYGTVVNLQRRTG